MKKGQKSNQCGLHSTTQLKETFQYLLEDFDIIYETVHNRQHSDHFTSLGPAINTRIEVLRNYYPNKSKVFISLYITLYDRWKKEN